MKVLYLVTSFFIVMLSVASVLFLLLYKQNSRVCEKISYTQHYDAAPITLPIHYDKNGVYIAQLTIDSQPVSAVVDTGSAHMLVAGSDCNTCQHPTKRHDQALIISKTTNDNISLVVKLNH